MIATANLENSRRLHELMPQCWDEVDYLWFNGAGEPTPLPKISLPPDVDYRHLTPAPDLGYLLGKLPDDVMIKKTEGGNYRVYAPKTVSLESIIANASTDAACLLLIKLIEEGVIYVDPNGPEQDNKS